MVEIGCKISWFDEYVIDVVDLCDCIDCFQFCVCFDLYEYGYFVVCVMQVCVDVILL